VNSLPRLVTFRVSRRYDAKCILVTAVCVYVCVSVPRRMPTLLHGLGCNLRNDRGCPLLVHYCAGLQSVHGFRCYDNITPNAKCQQVIVLAVCLVIISLWTSL